MAFASLVGNRSSFWSCCCNGSWIVTSRDGKKFCLADTARRDGCSAWWVLHHLRAPLFAASPGPALGNDPNDDFAGGVVQHRAIGRNISSLGQVLRWHGSILRLVGQLSFAASDLCHRILVASE